MQPKKPIHAGDIIAKGVGNDAATRAQRRTLAKRNAELGMDVMMTALCVSEASYWRLGAALVRIKARACADCCDGGLPVYASGATGAGIPISPAQRHNVEIAAFLRRLCTSLERVDECMARLAEDPEAALKALDKLDGLV